MNERGYPRCEFLLRPGYIFFNAEPSLFSTVLGSNVAVSIGDQKNILAARKETGKGE